MPKQTFYNLPLHKKENIKNATYKIFIEEGFDEASIRKVAAYADISIGSFYQYFEDITDLYLYFFIQTEVKYLNRYLENSKSFLFEKVYVSLEEVLSEEEIQFNNTWYNAPIDIVQNFYFKNYCDEILFPVKEELDQLMQDGRIRKDITVEFIYYIYKTNLFNLLMFFKEKNITDINEKYHYKRIFYNEILLNSILIQ